MSVFLRKSEGTVAVRPACGAVYCKETSGVKLLYQKKTGSDGNHTAVFNGTAWEITPKSGFFCAYFRASYPTDIASLFVEVGYPTECYKTLGFAVLDEIPQSYFSTYDEMKQSPLTQSGQYTLLRSYGSADMGYYEGMLTDGDARTCGDGGGGELSVGGHMKDEYQAATSMLLVCSGTPSHCRDLYLNAPSNGLDNTDSYYMEANFRADGFQMCPYLYAVYGEVDDSSVGSAKLYISISDGLGSTLEYVGGDGQ